MREGNILVADVGGNNLKIVTSTHPEKRKVPSGPDFTPQDMVEAVGELAKGLEFDRISIGIPAPVRYNRVEIEPFNLGPGWVGFDFQAAFDMPTRVVNDALMQALGSYEGGTMLFVGLGTGLGGALVIEGHATPLEVAHLPYKRDRTFEDYVGRRGLKRMGHKKWQSSVFDVVERLRLAMVADYVVIGGGNAKKLTELPPHSRRGKNENAFIGGFRIWEGASAD